MYLLKKSNMNIGFFCVPRDKYKVYLIMFPKELRDIISSYVLLNIIDVRLDEMEKKDIVSYKLINFSNIIYIENNRYVFTGYLYTSFIYKNVLYNLLKGTFTLDKCYGCNITVKYNKKLFDIMNYIKHMMLANYGIKLLFKNNTIPFKFKYGDSLFDSIFEESETIFWDTDKKTKMMLKKNGDVINVNRFNRHLNNCKVIDFDEYFIEGKKYRFAFDFNIENSKLYATIYQVIKI